MGDPTVEQIGREVPGVDEVADAEANDDEHVVEDEISVEEELKCLAQARRVLERSWTLCDASGRSFYNCQRALCLKKVSNLNQTSILDHLSKK